MTILVRMDKNHFFENLDELLDMGEVSMFYVDMKTFYLLNAAQRDALEQMGIEFHLYKTEYTPRYLFIPDGTLIEEIEGDGK